MKQSRTTQDVALTAREAQVVALLMDGNSSQQIGRALTITERTVRFHLQNIFAKLGAENRVQVVSKAIRLGLVGEHMRGEAAALTGNA